MTREEKEQIDKYVLQMARLLEDGCYQQEMLLKAVHIIDEALEQEPTTKNDLGVETTQMIDKSNFSQEQYKADLQSAYDCGYAQAKKDLGVDCIDRAKAQTEIEMKASRYTIAKERGGMGQVEWSDQLIKVSDAVDIIRNLPSVTPQEPVLDKINKMKSEIADSLEFWDYSPNNNPLARDILETLTNFWGDLRGEEE